jgi:epoxyqueuosine reductase
MGNRIYGCDDCQLICPWNKYAKLSLEADFQARHQLDEITLESLYSWDEEYFLATFEGSPIRRIGFQRWQRNIAVALGNAPWKENIIRLLENKLPLASELVTEHILWAIEQQKQKSPQQIIAISKNVNNNSTQRLNDRLIRSIEKGLPRDA